MNLIVKVILIDYNFSIGSWKIEERVRRYREGASEEFIPDGHLRATRIVKEEIMYNWLDLIRQIIQMHFNVQGIPVDPKRLFQEEFSEQLWINIENFLRNLKDLPLWVDRDKTHIFSAKQSHEYWAEVFKTGKTPDNIKLLSEGINPVKMIKQG